MEQRVQKILSNRGFCSRRKAEELIEHGKVKVNGKTITIGDKADPEKDNISVDNKDVPKQMNVYVMLNKPRGIMTTLRDPYAKKTIQDLVDLPERVFPVGRLDKDATGLLILTNDGDYANTIMHPRHETKKTYHVKLDKPISKEHVAAIHTGIRLKDGPVHARIIKQAKDEFDCVVHEGRHKIVKRIFNHFDYHVISLQRTKIGNLRLDVKPGRWRYLTKTEAQKAITHAPDTRDTHPKRKADRIKNRNAKRPPQRHGAIRRRRND